MKNRIAIFSVPIDDLDYAETVEKILKTVEAHKAAHPGYGTVDPLAAPPNYVATLNLDFLHNIHGFRLNEIQHLELMQTLLTSAHVSADGMPIVWLSRLLGCPIRQRVTGADLTPLLIEVLSDKGLSIFLFGPSERVAQKAAQHLKRINPGLKIKGAVCPMVFTRGAKISASYEQDRFWVEEINKAAPDILLISLGNPKQEIWFQRNKHRLKVPLAIGIGGTLNFLTGDVQRAPSWMQNCGLEWLFRWFQEPKRLTKRYVFNALHFLHLALPLLVWHGLCKLCAKEDEETRPPLLFLSKTQSIALVRAPGALVQNNAEHFLNNLDEAFAQDAVIIDFRETSFIDPVGLAAFIHSLSRAAKEGKKIYHFGIGLKLKALFMLHHTWPLIADFCYRSSSQITEHLETARTEGGTLYEAVHQREETVIISYFGHLDQREDFQERHMRLAPMLKEKECIIDLTYCCFIDNSGFHYLLELQRFARNQGKSLSIRGVNHSLRRFFKIAGLQNCFVFA